MHLSDNIDFTSATVGGLLIGVSSTALLFSLGKISGISGIVGKTVIPCQKSTTLSAWISAHSTNMSYILGLLSAGHVYLLQHPDFHLSTGHGEKATLATVLAGLLVGFGARMGSGCVSGHGVCGLPRLSLRSLTAVSIFMMTGAGGALLGRALEVRSPEELAVPGVSDLLRWVHEVHDGDSHLAGGHVPAVAVAMGLFAFFLALRGARGLSRLHQAEAEAAARRKKTDGDAAAVSASPPATRPVEHAIHFVTAFGFGWGLCLSGMTNAGKVRGFLDFSGPQGWDPSLMGVMAGAVGFNLISFRLLRHWQVTPVCLAPPPSPSDDDQALHKAMKYGAAPENLAVNWKLVLGATIFGVGWGLGGLCPGTSLVQLGTHSPLAQVYVPCLLLGMAAQELLMN